MEFAFSLGLVFIGSGMMGYMVGWVQIAGANKA
jgi:hypothetical protein